jgi:hypothetical protein
MGAARVAANAVVKVLRFMMSPFVDTNDDLVIAGMTRNPGSARSGAT